MSLQPILCSDKGRASDLSLVINHQDDSILVMLGVAVLERVRCTREQLQYKMLVGRLVNGGWSLTQLQEQFGHDPRTMKRWAAALLSEDPETMVRAFSGRGGTGKVTGPIERFVAESYRELRQAGRRDYRQCIQAKVKAYFGEQLSRETLRQLFRRVDEEDAEAVTAVPDGAARASGCPSARVVPAQVPSATDKWSPDPGAADALPLMLPDEGERPLGVHHLGMMLFAVLLQVFCRLRSGSIGWQTQWIGQVLQGAVNIEQSRLISSEDLSRFTGQVNGSVAAQREALKELATAETIADIYQANTRLLPDGPGRDRVFYYDPHSKEYTGIYHVLKDWCGRRHGVAKVLHLDMIHTRSGRCCFAQHYSPYYDLRERFFMTLESFNKLFPADQRCNRLFILDRGIYGLATFRRFLAAGDHILSWEKDYQRDGWDDGAPTITFTRTRPRNHATDLRAYRFECQEQTWSRDPRYRRFIVRATNPKGRTIEVAVVCSCHQTALEEAVWLIFNRWLQENHFKYLDRHFGLNQLTSYATTTFAQQRAQFTDQTVDTREYKELKHQLATHEQQLARHLLKRERLSDQRHHLDQENAQLDQDIDLLLPALQRRLHYLRQDTTDDTDPTVSTRADALLKRIDTHLRQHARQQRQHDRLQPIITKLKTTIADLDTRLGNALRHQSRLQFLIDENYRLLDTRAKACLDALRITASSMFASLLDHFRPLYNNYRNDHVMLRQLTRASGFLYREQDTLHVQLWLKGRYQPHQLRAFHRFLAQLSEQLTDYFYPHHQLRFRIYLLDHQPQL